jgi:hypothetical protein
MGQPTRRVAASEQKGAATASAVLCAGFESGQNHVALAQLFRFVGWSMVRREILRQGWKAQLKHSSPFGPGVGSMPTMVPQQSLTDPVITLKFVCTDCAWVFHIKNLRVGTVDEEEQATAAQWYQQHRCEDFPKLSRSEDRQL